MSETRKDKPWIYAAEVLEESGKFESNSLITNEEIRELLEVEFSETRKYTYKEIKNLQLRLLSRVENLKSYLLETKSVYLVSERGLGYRVASPDDQVVIVSGKGYQAILKAIADVYAGLKNIRHDQLSDEKARDRENSLIRFSFIDTSVKRSRKTTVAELRNSIESK